MLVEMSLRKSAFKKQLVLPQTELPERTLFVEKQRTYKPDKWANAVAMNRRWRLVNAKELYDLSSDRAEKKNVAAAHPEKVAELTQSMNAIVTNGRTTPGVAQTNDTGYWEDLVWMTKQEYDESQMREQ